jgi:uncharacterized protein YeaO (DUF488 family)
MPVLLKRAYESPSTDDGERYLVERLWPRGVAKKDLELTGWLRGIAPSTELRKWYGHVEERWPEFARLYKQELTAPEKQTILSDLAQKARAGNVTLVFATRVAARSGAKVLKDLIDTAGRRSKRNK